MAHECEGKDCNEEEHQKEMNPDHQLHKEGGMGQNKGSEPSHGR
jgi:hypothetical protein